MEYSVYTKGMCAFFQKVKIMSQKTQKSLSAPSNKLWTRLKKYKYVYLMLLPILAYYFIFEYLIRNDEGQSRGIMRKNIRNGYTLMVDYQKKDGTKLAKTDRDRSRRVKENDRGSQQVRIGK